MKIKINYPSKQSECDLLNNSIAVFKANLFIESIIKLNVNNVIKKEILKSLIRELD